MKEQGQENIHSLRLRAHWVFDRLWKKSAHPHAARVMAYCWLQETLGLCRDRAHFATMNHEQCRRAINAAGYMTLPKLRDWWGKRQAAKKRGTALADAVERAQKGDGRGQ